MKTKDILIWILAVVILLSTLYVLSGCTSTKNPHLYDDNGKARIRNQKVGS